MQDTETQYDYEGGRKDITKIDEEEHVDFQRAMQNLSDILIDSEKFKFMVKTLYDAIDTEN